MTAKQAHLAEILRKIQTEVTVAEDATLVFHLRSAEMAIKGAIRHLEELERQEAEMALYGLA